MVRAKVNEMERETSVEKVEQILQGAMQEFLMHGFAGTSMDRVASAAGVSKATVYSHFADKETLFKAMTERLAHKKYQSIFGSEPLEGEPLQVLHQIGTRALEQMSTDQEHCAFMRVLIGESGRFPELAQVCVSSMIKPSLETLTQYLMSYPELKIRDPEAIARILVGSLVHFHITQEVLHGENIIPMKGDRIIDTIIELIQKSGQST
ncbi:MAG: TetR/AcrR family transcriptional regulator [Pelatocladus maniniholoensis HA4357-MV3]|jgi:TetR/AcrR family transcriptional regulator of autoinduction and epiphytic fitness|uniref:TetR/AcrR family transcriptional regulator n=1 Tax=Pelatocladus maniniholoensis HA4357-MV3 TaxID=1117104 RepID=A0A9E3HBS6_9NOST|nr:TetR/AcrR family transcriptional regulator [Pelatocladus maniniholoensis HA4357-MV3]BAZ69851.1 TetR family transcriptional regulator [Fischerella sp. NIES-4106]